jgi:hypothetical protein
MSGAQRPLFGFYQSSELLLLRGKLIDSVLLDKWPSSDRPVDVLKNVGQAGSLKSDRVQLVGSEDRRKVGVVLDDGAERFARVEQGIGRGPCHLVHQRRNGSDFVRPTYRRSAANARPSAAREGSRPQQRPVGRPRYQPGSCFRCSPSFRSRATALVVLTSVVPCSSCDELRMYAVSLSRESHRRSWPRARLALGGVCTPREALPRAVGRSRSRYPDPSRQILHLQEIQAAA